MNVVYSIRCSFCNREWDAVDGDGLQSSLNEAFVCGWVVPPTVTGQTVCPDCVPEYVGLLARVKYPHHPSPETI